MDNIDFQIGPRSGCNITITPTRFTVKVPDESWITPRFSEFLICVKNQYENPGPENGNFNVPIPGTSLRYHFNDKQDFESRRSINMYASGHKRIFKVIF